MIQEGNLRAKGKTVQVAVEMDGQKSRPLKEIEREFLQKYIEN